MGGDKKYPEKEEYVVTEIKNSRIAAKNKTTGRVVERHLTRFVKLQNPEKNLEDSEKEVEGIDEEIDVPYLPIIHQGWNPFQAEMPKMAKIKEPDGDKEMFNLKVNYQELLDS